MKTINLFKVEKRGRGWSVIHHISGFNKLPDITTSVKNVPMKYHKTISQMKKNFEGAHIYTFIYEYNIVAPSDIYQVVVECLTEEEAERVRLSMERNLKGDDYVFRMDGKCHLKYSWVDEAPKEFITKLKEI